MPRIEIIAEIGVNHNGDSVLAKEMVDALLDCGVCTIKFQTYKAEEVMTKETPLANYMKNIDSPNFLEMAKKLELTNQTTEELKSYCESKNVSFLSSPFDVASVHYLKNIKVDRLKIPSGEIINPFLMKAAAETQLPLIISTGMSTIPEIQWAITNLKKWNSGPISILHCLSQYPAEYKYVNLKAMQTIADAFHLPTGFSDHTPGIDISLAAAAMGAVIIEKHFTLDKSLAGPDHAASLNPEEMKNLVCGIRNIEQAMGNGIKEPAEPELNTAAVARKSLVLLHDLKEGTKLTEQMLTAKRPGTGISSIHLEKILGKTLITSLNANHILQKNDLKELAS